MKDCFQFIAKNIRKLRKLRKIKGFTQERLAEEADISVTHLNKFENGKSQLSMTAYLVLL